jgi:hypothetical protein
MDVFPYNAENAFSTEETPVADKEEAVQEENPDLE